MRLFAGLVMNSWYKEKSMIPTLEAQFDQRTLINTLHYLVQTQSSGQIRLETPNELWANLYLENGKVVHLDSSEGKTASKLAEITTWQAGSFRFYEGVAAPERTLKVMLQNLLPPAEGEEAKLNLAVSTIHLSGESVLTSNETMSLQDDTASINYIGVQMLLHIDGKRSLSAIAQVVGQPLDTIIAIAQDLCDSKMLQLVGTRPLYVSSSFFKDLHRMATPYFGPVAEFLIEDSVEDLGHDIANFPYSEIYKLFSLLRQHLNRSDWQIAFKKDFALLCRQYGIIITPSKNK